MPRNNVSRKFKDWVARVSALLASTMRWEVLLVFKRRGATSIRSGGARRSMSRAAMEWHDGMSCVMHHHGYGWRYAAPACGKRRPDVIGSWLAPAPTSLATIAKLLGRLERLRNSSKSKIVSRLANNVLGQTVASYEPLSNMTDVRDMKRADDLLLSYIRRENGFSKSDSNHLIFVDPNEYGNPHSRSWTRTS